MYIHNMICKLDPIPEERLNYGEAIYPHKRTELTDIDDIKARETDIKIFTDEKIRKIYMDKNNPNSINKFEFVLVNYGENNRFISKEELIESYNLPEKEDGITRVIFRGNFSKDFYPFTRWILAHRTFHTGCFVENSTEFYNSVDSFISDITINVLGLPSHYRFINPLNLCRDKYFGGMINTGNKKTNFCPKFSESEAIDTSNKVRSVLKFRSARESDRLIDLDIYAELFAQYQITGNISFNKTNNDDINNIIEKYTPILNDQIIDVCKKVDNKVTMF